MTKFAGRPYAVFDIDGTLYRWQLFHELVQELTFTDAFPPDVFHYVNDAWNQWRGGDLAFDEYELRIIHTLEKHLPSIPVATYLEACNRVVSQSKHKTYHYPRALLKQLKSEGYVIMAISGSQQELLDLFGEHYGFDIVVGALYENDGTNFTGKMTRRTVGRKHEILDDLIREHSLISTGSLSIGDSDGDAALLELVEKPIAFNPSEGLFERAKDESWPIVIERKNIAYRLENQNDALVLAETIIF
jgi:HAD superfamily phosphoserine phosphatase-like hydrolase